jgi:DNA polymerase-3 subunit delta'
MAFADFPEQVQGVKLLQRSLGRGRLGHAYLFAGDELGELEGIARTLAKVLNCLQPVRTEGVATDCCDGCVNCRKIENGNHADVHWVRPESKSRVVTMDQMRGLMREIYLKPTEAEFKVGVVVAADRLNVNSANAFLKTLEEPPAKSVLILLTTEPQRLLETIVSRCLRLSFGGAAAVRLQPEERAWLEEFGAAAAGGQKSLLSRYRLLDVVARRLAETKKSVEESLTARSPLEKYEDAEKDLRERWEDELTAAVESEYRRLRGELLQLVQWWFRDVWLRTLGETGGLLSFPESQATATLAQRVGGAGALENLRVLEQTQRLLHTNVQEALALEVSLLRLRL